MRAIFAFCIVLGGCAGNPTSISVTSDTYCKVYRKISWVPDDTVDTITQIRRENAKHDRLCRAK